MSSRKHSPGSVCYTGLHAKPDGVHTPDEFKQRVKRVCTKSGDCPRAADVRAWADWAGAIVMSDPDGEMCRYYSQTHGFLNSLMRAVAAHGSATVQKRGAGFVISGGNASTSARGQALSTMYAAHARAVAAHPAAAHSAGVKSTAAKRGRRKQA